MDVCCTFTNFLVLVNLRLQWQSIRRLMLGFISFSIHPLYRLLFSSTQSPYGLFIICFCLLIFQHVLPFITFIGESNRGFLLMLFSLLFFWPINFWSARFLLDQAHLQLTWHFLLIFFFLSLSLSFSLIVINFVGMCFF